LQEWLARASDGPFGVRKSILSMPRAPGDEALRAGSRDPCAGDIAAADTIVYPFNYPERWDVIDGSIGELSPFHDTFGYYAQGVEEGTAILPEGWKRRLIEVHGPGTRGVRGEDPHRRVESGRYTRFYRAAFSEPSGT